MDSVIELFRLAYAGGAITLTQAQLLYRKLIWAIFGAIAIILVGWVCNLAGYREVSIILSLVLTVLTTIVWLQPKYLVPVAGAGAVVGAIPRIPGTVASDAQKFVSIYFDILGKVLLWGSILLFILGTIPFGENRYVIFGLTAALILLALINWQWKIGTDGGKRLFRWYVCAMITVFLASLVPGPIWVKYMPYGWDPTTIGTTRTEDAQYRLKKVVEERADATKAAPYEEVAQKIKTGRPLTDADKRIVAKAQQTKPSSPPVGTRRAVGDQVYEVPPHGSTSKMKAQDGFVVKFSGDGFEVHCVYNGRQITLPKTEHCKPSTDLLYQLAQNTTGAPITIGYSFERE